MTAGSQLEPLPSGVLDQLRQVSTSLERGKDA